ncbi:unnamed protein product [Adineta ricciae]|uniref:HAT C-terminal dimerisation domain-containing protein n=1 Tax=Adineta ricciae TaxID=249248 RepID=A0A815RD41_ADIRI|nr:unnamed protein product [Adineta ricciae]
MATVLHSSMKHLQKLTNDMLLQQLHKLTSCCFDQLSKSNTVADSNDEIKRYLQSHDSIIGTEDPLPFWTRHKNSHPILYSIATEILIIPDSNTAVERLFSASGKNSYTSVRTRLSTQKVDKLMFKKKLPSLKKLFGTNNKLNNFNDSLQSTTHQSKKRPHDTLSSSDSDSDCIVDDIKE